MYNILYNLYNELYGTVIIVQMVQLFVSLSRHCTDIVRFVQIIVHFVQYTYNARTINCIGECYVQLIVSVSVPVQLNVSLHKYLYYGTIPECTTSAQVPRKATTRT